MRLWSVLVVCALAGCPVERARVVSGLHVRDLPSPPRAEGIERRFEITSDGDARVIFALGDRIADLDLTPATPSDKQADALVTFAPLSKGKPIEVTLRARPWKGDDVLAQLVAPLGGDDARKALLAASPEFAKQEMVEVELAVTNGTTTQFNRRRFVITPGERFGMSQGPVFGDGYTLALGSPCVVYQWVMAQAGSGFIPNVHVVDDKLFGYDVKRGADVTIDQLPAAVWTLWMQVE